MISPGQKVRAKKAKFEGVLLAKHGNISGGGFSYWSVPSDLNVAVSAVWNQDTGEVRFFVMSELEAVD